jgi:hypothetical protein
MARVSDTFSGKEKDEMYYRKRESTEKEWEDRDKIYSWERMDSS